MHQAPSEDQSGQKQLGCTSYHSHCQEHGTQRIWSILALQAEDNNKRTESGGSVVHRVDGQNQTISRSPNHTPPHSLLLRYAPVPVDSPTNRPEWAAKIIRGCSWESAHGPAHQVARRNRTEKLQERLNVTPWPLTILLATEIVVISWR